MGVQRKLMIVSVALYIASLIPDSFCIGGYCSGWPGWGILLVGWLALLATPANMTWLANPVLFVCWGLMLRSRWRAALVVGIAALAGGGSFLLHDKILSSESGSLTTITGTALGYWLWLASMAVACIGAGSAVWRDRRNSVTP